MTPNTTRTADIACAFSSSNRLPVGDVPSLIATVHAALESLGRPREPEEPAKRPAGEVRRSITPDALVSFLDGKPYRSLKRHLATHGLTPATYIAKFGLPADYPMVCEASSRGRSEAAIARGFGRKPIA